MNVIWFILYVLLSFTDKPDKPVDLNVQSVTATSIYLDWTQPDGADWNQITFSIVYHPLLNETFTRNYTCAATEFNLTNLLPATSYLIYVIAQNKYFNGERSDHII